jgi:hypothetical protein
LAVKRFGVYRTSGAKDKYEQLLHRRVMELGNVRTTQDLASLRTQHHNWFGLPTPTATTTKTTSNPPNIPGPTLGPYRYALDLPDSRDSFTPFEAKSILRSFGWTMLYDTYVNQGITTAPNFNG